MDHFAATLLRHHGLGAIFLLILLESAGLPLPGEAAMIGAALYAAKTHQLSVMGITVSASTGAILGYLAGYLIGRAAGVRLLDRYGRRIGLTPPRRALARYLTRRSGFALVFFGRFIAVLRSTAGLLAGTSGMGAGRFMAANLAGGIVWPAVYCLGTYRLGDAMLHLAGRATLLLGLAIAVALVLGYRFVRRHEQQLTAKALAEEETA